MKKLHLGLITKITIIVSIVELIAFGAFGYFYFTRYANDIENNLKNKISIINKMIATEQFAISYLGDKDYISKMIGQPYESGFVVGGNGYIIVSTNLEYLGKKLEELPKYDEQWNFTTSNELYLSQNDQLTSIAYLTNMENQPLYRTVITVSTKEFHEEKNQVLLFGIATTLFFILLSSFAIIFFAKRLITQRVDDSLDVLKKVENGDLTAYIHDTNSDELGMIQSGINSMIKEVDKKTKNLSKNIAFLKSHQLAMDESSIVSKANLKGNITYVNDNFINITGFSKEEVMGKPHSIIRHPDTSKDIFKELWSTIQNKKVWKGIIKNKGKLADYWVDIVVLPILDENENIVEYIAIRHDITRMINQQIKLDSIANTDILTGLGSRYKLNNDIKNSIIPSVAIVNIDNFSQVNDFYGHESGDYIIKEIASKLLTLIDDKNYQLYHLQGDEYVIFHPNITKSLFIELIHKLNASLPKIEIDLNDESLNFNFSVGLSFENKNDILSTADMALKIAKLQNTNIVIYSDEISLNKEYENNIKWAKKIKYAIENDKFVPVFQPIVNNRTGIWEKYESLVRLIDEDKLISPYFFLDISKKTKHYTKITQIMIEKSFEFFKDKDVEFSINLTIEDILNSDIKTFIFTALEQYQIGKRVVFEIVESESIQNFKDVLGFIEDIKTYGAKIAIDDFGTGYSNFEYLVKLNADYIKIDGSLIKDLASNKTSQIVVKNIVNFANDLGMKTIAEFVENESILEKLKELGVDYSQGYHFSQPRREI
ncbi:MAG: EAL domain-containing protein [Arcobacteraceae bacterium]|nr:EAL domain-containing protein [Arcobacteraceae bacterium]